METTSLSAAAKLIMMLICLCGMPDEKEMLRADGIDETGIVESVAIKPIDGGYDVFESAEQGADKLAEIRRGEAPTSFVLVGEDLTMDLTEVFPNFDFSTLTTITAAELKTADGDRFKVTKSGGTMYVTSPSGFTLSVHK